MAGDRGCCSARTSIARHHRAHAPRGGDLAAHELLVVVLDFARHVQIVDHHPQRLPQPLLRNVRRPVDALQQRAVVEMESRDRVLRRARCDRRAAAGRRRIAAAAAPSAARGARRRSSGSAAILVHVGARARSRRPRAPAASGAGRSASRRLQQRAEPGGEAGDGRQRAEHLEPRELAATGPPPPA